MATTTSLGLHAPIGADPFEPAAVSPAAKLTNPTDVALLAAQLNLLIPQPGFIQPTASAGAPAGWLPCDGAAVTRASYARLFAAISTTYGTGDGTTTFNVPDIRGRVPVGIDGAAARLTASDALGQSGGTEKHTLTAAEIPDHQHAISVWDGVTVAIGTKLQLQASIQGHDTSTTFGTGPLSGGSPVADGGGDGTHNNMQPYVVVNWLVKT